MSRLLAAFVLSAATVPALAGALDLNALQQLGQGEFRQLSEDLGAALSYKPLAPAAPLGILGFDIGLAATATTLKDTAVLQKAATGTVHETLPVPSLRIEKGLPFDVDVGLMATRVPGSHANLMGADLKWAFLPGSVLLPAVALRASATRLAGVSQLGLTTTGLDLSVSKGFAFITPYLGAGEVWIHSAPRGVPALATESFGRSKVYAGVDINAGLLNLDLELDQTGGITSYGLKGGLRF